MDIVGMAKNMIFNGENSDMNSITRKMLNIIRENNNAEVNASKKLLKEETNKITPHDSEGFKITKTTPMFGDVRVSQEESLIKTIGESIELDENSLVYYKEDKDLVLTGKLNSLKVVFQFRSNDDSGEGCYIWANMLRLTEANTKTIGMIRNAFSNWKNSLTENGDFMEKLHQASEKGNDNE